MQTYQDIKTLFDSGKIDKPEFIKWMHSRNQVLFDACRHISGSNLAQINILPGRVLACFRDPSITMLCPADDDRIAPMEAFNFGDYEHTELQLLRRIIQMLGGSSCLFIDIGANAGFYSLALSNYFPGITGIAFEPVPKTYQILEQNLDLNTPNNITAVNVGLSNKSGTLVFYTYTHQSSAAGMTRNLTSSPATEVHCEVKTLDECSELLDRPIDLIKCDIEGAEIFAFQGGIKTIQRDCPLIFTEMLRKWSAQHGYHPNEIINLFTQLGYSCFEIKDSRLSMLIEMTDETRSTNFFFCHRTKHKELISALSQ